VLPRSTRHIATVVAALAFGVAATPAHAAPDPLLDQQWGLEQSATGAPEAWTQSHGAGVLVAILDSGVQLNHPDLVNNLWRNPNEIPANGIDDDKDGYVDDVNGANIKELNGNVSDDNGHGTHVAGIVAAQAGNGIGGSGIAPDAKIMAVKVLDANRSGDSSRLAKGIVYAVDRGAKILNVSINGDGTSGDLDAALKYAGSKGATVVASARPDLPQSTLRDALTQSAPRPSLLSGLLGGGSLNVGAAMHRILPGSQWKDSPTQDVALPLDESQATLEVSSKKRVRKGRSATVRWTATGAASVVQWRVSLNGKRISTLPGTKTVLRKRVNKAGTNRWKVVGLDADGEPVVSATRKFKVVTAR
jgi:hypothetical protein